MTTGVAETGELSARSDYAYDLIDSPDKWHHDYLSGYLIPIQH